MFGERSRSTEQGGAVYQHEVSIREEKERGTSEPPAPKVLDLVGEGDDILIEDESCRRRAHQS